MFGHCRVAALEVFAVVVSLGLFGTAPIPVAGPVTEEQQELFVKPRPWGRVLGRYLRLKAAVAV